MKKTNRILLFLVFFSSLISTGQTPGTLDTDFGQSGITYVDFEPATSTANKVLVTEEGKILTLGYSGIGTWDKSVNLSRHFEDGFIDNSFGSGGKVGFSLGGSDSQASDMMLDPEGRIYLTGYCSDGPTQDLVICRLNAEGFIDESFGTDGFSKTDLGHDETGSSILFQEDGKILVLGHVLYNNGQSDMLLCRYHADGSTDYGFNNTGRVVKDLNTSSIDMPRGLALHQGKILIASYAYNSDPDDYAAIVLARFNMDGSIDQNFAVSGYTIYGGYGTNPPDLLPTTDMLVCPDDKILLTCPVYGIAGYSHILFKYLENGYPDMDFYDNGSHLTIMIGESAPNTLILQPDERILVGGYHQSLTDEDFCLSRYFQNGEYDPVFGQYYGVSWLDLSNGDGADERIMSLAMQGDGKIIAAGYSVINGYREFVIARYISGLHVSAQDIRKGNTNIQIYPNPIEQSLITCDFQLKEKETIEMYLYHLDGRKWGLLETLQMAENESQKTVKLPDQLQNGHYLIHFSGDKTSEFKKVTIINK